MTEAVYTMPPDGPFGEMPDVLVQAFTDARPARARTATADGEAIPEGGRDNYLASIAGTMRRRGMTRREIEAALQVINAERCEPPLDSRDVERIAWSVAQYAANDPVLTRISKAEAELEVIEADEPDNLIYERASFRWLNVREMLEADPPSHDWLLEGLVERGEIVWLAGAGKVGKSMVALHLGVAAVQARATFLGRTLSEVPHLIYLDCENRDKTVARRLHLAGVPLELADRISYGSLRGANLGSEEGLLALELALREHPGALLVLDSLVGLHRSDEDKATEVRQFVLGIRSVAERHGVTVIGLAHENRGGSIRGSLDWVNAVDAVLTMTREDDGDGGTVRKIKAGLMRDSEGGAELTFDFQTADVDGRRVLRIVSLDVPETVAPEPDRGAKLKGTADDYAARLERLVREDPEVSPWQVAGILGVDAETLRGAAKVAGSTWPRVMEWERRHHLVTGNH